MNENQVSLRKLTMHDEQTLYRLIASSLPQLQQFLPWAQNWHGRVAVRQYLLAVAQNHAAGKQLVWLIVHQQQPVGLIDLHNIDHATQQAEIGYWVATFATRQGIATAAGRAVIQQAQALALRQLVILVDAKNHASQRVARKLGFEQQRVLTNYSKSQQMLEYLRVI